ncbi:MAG: DEAD/DEAH box helicase, partial [Acidimicrobiales bacterium]|nr:DEAD/DEAH box helicase [Acidimicrobiales bacterium]
MQRAIAGVQRQVADLQALRRLLADHRQLAVEVRQLEGYPDVLAAEVRRVDRELRRAAAWSQMTELPLGRLGETAKGLRLGALQQHGYATVAQILVATTWQLQSVPGVGDTTASQVLAAARQVQAAAESSVRLHFDLITRDAAQTSMLGQLRRYDLAMRTMDESEAMRAWLVSTAAPLAARIEPIAGPWHQRLFLSRAQKDVGQRAAADMTRHLTDPGVVHFRRTLGAALQEIQRHRNADEVWHDYEENAAHLLGILGEIVEGSGSDAGRGHLPQEIAERVKAFTLDQSFLTASLRGYQAFGAKYALVQERSILGDEMGLGKTIEALAALCHLRAGGQHRALVVCPASVVTNWRMEIRRHTKLDSSVLHGADRDRSHRSWLERGGVAITTFDGLRRFAPEDLRAAVDEGGRGGRLGMLVVDEAHYVKNPKALRSRAVASWAGAADRVLFLTGTPMENRVDEFRSLIHHLQPEIAQRVTATAALAGPVAFQQAVAPAYLRRNQLDVLNELPEMIPSLDWVDPTPQDLHAYGSAVSEQAFQTMRRAAYLSIPDGGPRDATEAGWSAKTGRLLDIIGEANEEGLKVVVFSYFRDVLDRVTRAAALVLPDAVHGPLTGSTPPAERQRLIDALSAHPGGAVLTAQIEAGGVGLNMQAASVVVICEP